MDILSLSLKATAEAIPAFGPEKGLKGAFAESFAGAKGLAPPGPEPPPMALLAKSGEEGATPEPIAPAQDPDFSPDLSNEIDPGDPNILIDFDLPAAKPKEAVKVGNRKPLDDASAAGLQTVACFGAIKVPVKEPPDGADLSIDAVQTKQTERFNIERPKKARNLKDAGLHLGWSKPFTDEKGKVVDPIKVDRDWPHVTGARPKPKEFVIDHPVKQGPILQVPVSFHGERPKKHQVSQGDEVPMPFGNSKPWKGIDAVPIAGVNGPRPRVASVDAAPVKSEKQTDQSKATKEPSEKINGPKPQVINLGNDVLFKGPLLEIPGHPQNNVTDPFIPEKPLLGDGKESKGQKHSADAVPVADIAKFAEAAKGDATKSGDGANTNRSMKPILKPETKLASEKEEFKVQPAESKPSVEAIAKPNQIASDNVPQKSDLSPKQSEEVVRQVLDRIDALAASRSGRKVTIHLDPKEFGSITLVVGRRGGEVDAEIYASNDRVRHALEANRPNLAAGLDQRGIQLSSMTVGSELPHGSGRQEQAMHQMARQHHPNMSRFEKTETTTLSIDAIRGLARKASGVDLWT